MVLRINHSGIELRCGGTGNFFRHNKELDNEIDASGRLREEPGDKLVAHFPKHVLISGLNGRNVAAGGLQTPANLRE
jgi:hypothetical protein